MASYTEQVLVEKLNKMSTSQQSIQTLSHWIIYHRKRFVQSVQIWEKEIYTAPTEKKITFLYLANDVMQTSRKKGGEFIKEFSKVLPKTVEFVYRTSDTQTHKAILRLIEIWEERRVLSSPVIEEMKSMLFPKGKVLSANDTSSVSYNNVQQINDSSVFPSALLMQHPSKDNPVNEALLQVEEIEVAQDLAIEKVQNIRPEILNGQLLRTIQNEIQLVELTRETEEAQKSLIQYRRKLEENLKRRSSLIAILSECIEKQENLINKTTISLQDCDKQLAQIQTIKWDLESLKVKFPNSFSNKQETTENTYSPGASPQTPTTPPRTPPDFSSDLKRQKFNHPIDNSLNQIIWNAPPINQGVSMLPTQTLTPSGPLLNQFSHIQQPTQFHLQSNSIVSHSNVDPRTHHIG